MQREEIELRLDYQSTDSLGLEIFLYKHLLNLMFNLDQSRIHPETHGLTS